MMLQPLTKIIVTESPLRCGPGSAGYVVAQNQYRGYNIWSRSVLLYRFGKGGKDRLELMALRDNIIEYDSMKGLSAKDKQMLHIISVPQGLYPQLHPCDVGKKKLRHSRSIDHTKFEPLDNDYKDTMDMPVWEFIAYIAAISIFLFSIEEGATADMLAVGAIPPNLGQSEDFPRHIPTVSSIWQCFIKNLKLDRSHADKTLPHESNYRKFFEVADNRMMYIEHIRESMAVMSRTIELYRASLPNIEKTQRSSLRNLLRHYKERMPEYKTMEKSVKAGNFLSVPTTGEIQKAPEKIVLRRA